jgi:hypothetical protein
VRTNIFQFYFENFNYGEKKSEKIEKSEKEQLNKARNFKND